MIKQAWRRRVLNNFSALSEKSIMKTAFLRSKCAKFEKE